MRGAGLALLVLGVPAAALAQDTMSFAPSGSDVAQDLLDEAEGRLLHPGSGGYHVPGGPPAGYLFGLDVGAAVPIAAGGEESQVDVSLGARLGYQFQDGLALALQYEALGLSPNLINGNALQFVTANVRYSFPFILPMPFVEAGVGLALGISDAPLAPGAGTVSAGLGGALGVGVSFPLTHHFGVDVGVRDWLASISGSFYQVVSLEAGVAFAFGGG